MKTTVKTKKGIQGKIEGGDNGEGIKGGKPGILGWLTGSKHRWNYLI